MRAVLLLLLIAFLSPPALAMPTLEGPDGDPAPAEPLGPAAKLIRERERMKAEYEEFREERRRAREAALSSEARPANDGVAGWKSTRPDTSAAPPGKPAPRGRKDWESQIILVAGAGIVLLLLIKLFRPDWLVLRHKKRARAERRWKRRDGPMTITLRPLSDRLPPRGSR